MFNSEQNSGNQLTEAGISWVIIGQCTPIKQSTAPSIDSVRWIVEAADKAGIPVFLKNNLKPLLDEDFHADTRFHQYIEVANDIDGGYWKLRQEMP